MIFSFCLAEADLYVLMLFVENHRCCQPSPDLCLSDFIFFPKIPKKSCDPNVFNSDKVTRLDPVTCQKCIDTQYATHHLNSWFAICTYSGMSQIPFLQYSLKPTEFPFFAKNIFAKNMSQKHFLKIFLPKILQKNIIAKKNSLKNILKKSSKI